MGSQWKLKPNHRLERAVCLRFPKRACVGAAATAEELIEFARSQLAHFKAPQGVTFVDELPKTATGKIQKYVLRGGRSAIAKQ